MNIAESRTGFLMLLGRRIYLLLIAMKMEKNGVLAFVSITFLVLAVFGSWPYDFFTILRFIVAGSAAVIAYGAYQAKKEADMIMFGIVAILFNPFLPIHLSRPTWQLIDLVTAGIFLYYAWRWHESE